MNGLPSETATEQAANRTISGYTRKLGPCYLQYPEYAIFTDSLSKFMPPPATRPDRVRPLPAGLGSVIDTSTCARRSLSAVFTGHPKKRGNHTNQTTVNSPITITCSSTNILAIHYTLIHAMALIQEFTNVNFGIKIRKSRNKIRKYIEPSSHFNAPYRKSNKAVTLF